MKIDAKGNISKASERIGQYTKIRAEKKYPPRILARTLNQDLLECGYSFCVENVFDAEVGYLCNSVGSTNFYSVNVCCVYLIIGPTNKLHNNAQLLSCQVYN
jgi:hypothetical protein